MADPESELKWSRSSLSELTSALTSGGTPESGNSRYYSDTGVPFAKIDDLTASTDRFLRNAKLRITQAALRESSAKVYPVGTILVSMYGTIGLTKTTTIPLAANQALAALLPPFICNADYLAQFLSWKREHLGRLALQTTQANISGSILKAFSVELPPPAEQRQIAEILDTLDEAIRKTEQIIAKLQQVKQGLLHDLLTRGIDDNGELRDPDRHPEQFKDSPLGRIPKGWEVCPACEVCSAVIDCKNRTPPVLPEGHPVIRTTNIRDGEFAAEGLVYTDPYSYAVWTQRGKPRAGDVLITREAPVGEVCLLPDWLGSACLGQRMMMYQVDSFRLRSDFMVVALMSPTVQKALRDAAGGSTVGHVRVSDIRNLLVPVPSMAEQSRIASAWSAHRERLRGESTSLSKLRLLKSGLMEDLLTGRVRVTKLLEQAAE